MTRLDTLDKIHPDLISAFLTTGKCDGIPADVQLFLKQLQWAAEIYEYERNITRAAKQLRQLLENSGVKVHNGAPYRLFLANEQETQRTASRSGSARSAELELTTHLDYEIRGEKNLLVLAAAYVAGVTRAFTIGGAQAVAALAYGTETVPKVDKITGPGNAYVASAKKRVFGTVGIDMIAGPSEILVLADGTTPPDWVAMDLFSQAEHDELAQSILLCPDAAYIDAVQEAIDRLLEAFVATSQRAVRAGYKAIELHAAHGYLLSQFLDPLINERDDEYGGSFDNRVRMLVEVVDAIRSVVPDTMPVLVRVSATDWAAGGWDLDQTVELAKILKAHGVDLIDVSTGGLIPDVTIPVKPDYQVPFAEQVRSRAGIPTTAVGLITKPKQAKKILKSGAADAVEIGRAALRDPYWPLRAAHKLDVPVEEAPYQPPYLRGAFR